MTSNLSEYGYIKVLDNERTKFNCYILDQLINNFYRIFTKIALCHTPLIFKYFQKITQHIRLFFLDALYLFSRYQITDKL